MLAPEPHTPLFKSIFSLRPLSHTEPAPPPEEPESPEPPRRRRRWTLIAAAAVGALGVSGGLAARHERRAERRVLIVSGVPSFRESNGHAERWQTSHLKVTIDDSVDSLGPGARDAIENAFGAWLGTGADLPSLTFDTSHGARPSETPDGRNTVMVAPIDIPGHENDLAITIGFSDADTGALVEADVVINSRHRFGVLGTTQTASTSQVSSRDAQGENLVGGDGGGSCTTYNASALGCGDRYDLQNVVTHEAGHFFGMADDLSDDHATMYKCTSVCETHKRDVDSADVQAMTKLYAGGFADDGPAAGCSSRVSPGRTSPSERSALAVMLALGVVGLVRRRRR
jgi:MYXO-CTERM domain-containing protein